MRGIYEIKNRINGKVYVGQSIHIEERIKRHQRELKAGIHHNHHLQRSYNKYGKENFEYIILYQAQQDEDLDELEKQYIEKENAFTNGYNATKGGAGDLGMIVTDEFREKMRQLVMGEKNPNYGHRWTDEMRRRMSEQRRDGSLKGKNNPRAIKVIRVEDCRVYDTQMDAAESIGLSSMVSISRCLKNKSYVAKGYHFVKYDSQIFEYLQDGTNRFWYLYECHKTSQRPIIVDFENKRFLHKQDFIREINHKTHIPTRKIRNIMDSSNYFIIDHKKYQLLVA